MPAADPPSTNYLLRRLPQAESHLLASQLKHVALEKGSILYEPEHAIARVVFIESGVVSLLSATHRGEEIQAALLSREGVLGAPRLLHESTMPYRATVEMPGDGLTIAIDALERLLPHLPTLQEGMLRSVHLLLAQVSQTAVCNRFHDSSQRLARWLLAYRDRAGTDTLNLTHEVLGRMVGVPRTWVTRIAGQLQEQGLLNYKRGVISISDPAGLARHSCECYEVLRRDLEEYLKA